jgi:hypothetical protein
VAADQPAGVVVGELVDDVQRLARLEVEMARREVKELLAANGIAVGSLSAAGILGFLAVTVGLPVLAIVSSRRPRAAAAFWVGLYLGGAAGLAAFGRSQLRLQPPVKTMQSLKENAQWLAQRIKSVAT